jgi:hypothetical protein
MKRLLLVLMICVLFSCSNVSDKIVDNLSQKCKAAGCTIKIKDVTDFEWGKLYLFGSWTEQSFIVNAIGFNYTGHDVQDDTVRLLFISGNEVVHEEDYDQSYFSFPEELKSYPGEEKKGYLTPATAVFNVAKVKADTSCNDCFYYSLSSIKK